MYQHTDFTMNRPTRSHPRDPGIRGRIESAGFLSPLDVRLRGVRSLPYYYSTGAGVRPYMYVRTSSTYGRSTVPVLGYYGTRLHQSQDRLARRVRWQENPLSFESEFIRNVPAELAHVRVSHNSIQLASWQLRQFCSMVFCLILSILAHHTVDSAPFCAICCAFAHLYTPVSISRWFINITIVWPDVLEHKIHIG